MAVLAAILPLAAQGSTLALLLYRVAAANPHEAKELLGTARGISNLALIVKEVGTIIKEDDRLPSAEAFETIEDVLDQSAAILDEIKSLVSVQNGEYGNGRTEQRNGGSALVLPPQSVARLHYLTAHLDSLRATLSVMLQTLYTAQSIMWAEVRPYVSPRQCATAVANEKQQLETLIIDQQMSILLASKLYEHARPDARFLMEDDSSQSLSRIDESSPEPSKLVKYQDRFIASLNIETSGEEHWLASVCGISKSQLDRLLERWTRLRQFEEDLLEDKRKIQAQKRETQQPFVESDSEDDIEVLPKLASNGVGINTTIPQRTDTVASLSTESTSLPIPIPTSTQDFASMPASPRSSISTLPVEAAAAAEAKDKDDELDLEIPWTLRTRRHYWKYIDGKVQETNTDMPPSEAFRHRHSWTEVQASWVCAEALQETSHPFTRVRKDIPDGRRTRPETWFCIDRPLTFDEIQRLVDRTVDLYRKTQPPSPPPRIRRSSFDRRSTSRAPLQNPDRDQDRTPLASQTKPPALERSTTTYHVSSPPPLDRAMSLPGHPPQTYASNPRPSNLMAPPPQTTLSQSAPFSPKPPPRDNPGSLHPSQTFPPPPPPPPAQPPRPFIPPPNYTQPSFPPPPPQTRHLHPHALPHPQVYSQSPLRTSLDGARYEHYSSASGTSDSEGGGRRGKVRSRSRRRERERSGEGRRKGRGYGGKTGALMGVAGLTALLDGLVGI